MDNSYIPSSKEDVYILIEKAHNGDVNAKEKVILDNSGLVRKVAFKFITMGYEMEDLMQIGFIGLIKAVDRFDTSFNVRFSTYAVPMIIGEIRKYIRDDGKIKVSRQLKQDIRKMKIEEEAFFLREGRYPKIRELAERMGATSNQIMEMKEAGDVISNIESLDNENRTEEAYESYFQEEEKSVDIIQLKSIIGKLTARERQIIVLRYFKDLTQEQTSKIVGVSQVQVSRIEKKVLKDIRKQFES